MSDSELSASQLRELFELLQGSQGARFNSRRQEYAGARIIFEKRGIAMANLTGAHLDGIDFPECIFVGVDLRGVRFTGDLSRTEWALCNLCRVNFAQASLEDATFYNPFLGRTLFPGGGNCFAGMRTDTRGGGSEYGFEIRFRRKSVTLSERTDYVPVAALLREIEKRNIVSITGVDWKESA